MDWSLIRRMRVKAKVPEGRFRRGQVWTFKDAPLSESRVIVGKVENIKGYGWVVSVCITNVHIEYKNGVKLTDISHIPISKEAMEASVVEHTETREPVDGFDLARHEWRELIDAREAGVFTVGVAEVAKLISDAIAKGHDVP